MSPRREARKGCKIVELYSTVEFQCMVHWSPTKQFVWTPGFYFRYAMCNKLKSNVPSAVIWKSNLPDVDAHFIRNFWGWLARYHIALLSIYTSVIIIFLANLKCSIKRRRIARLENWRSLKKAKTLTFLPVSSWTGWHHSMRSYSVTCVGSRW